MTYKLRLYPLLRNSRWGPFLDMWNELVQKYPTIAPLVSENNCHISFEIYGMLNAHLMLYDVDLAVVALFGIRQDASIVPVFNLRLFDVPAALFIDDISATDDPVKKYAEIREIMEQRMKHTDDEKLVGTEDTV